MTSTQPKLHVIFQKEDIVSDYIDQRKVAVVFDVLLATTTIATVLQHGASEVIPVMDRAEALQVMESLDAATAIMAGESIKVRINDDPDFLDPHLATASISFQMILNMFEGLVAPETDGTIKPAVAEDYTISEDGLRIVMVRL